MVSINYQGTVIKPLLTGIGLIAGILVGTTGHFGFLKTAGISVLLASAGLITGSIIEKK